MYKFSSSDVYITVYVTGRYLDWKWQKAKKSELDLGNKKERFSYFKGCSVLLFTDLNIFLNHSVFFSLNLSSKKLNFIIIIISIRGINLHSFRIQKLVFHLYVGLISDCSQNMSIYILTQMAET
jgi:hypothetical protein